MYDILLAIFFISAPIFYLWGLFRFVQRFFIKNDTNPQQQANPLSKERQFIDALFERVEENPDLSLSEFLDELRERKRAQYEADAIQDTATESDEPQKLGDMVSTPAPPAKPAFSWSAWYADNSIDFIMYLGAFMIVAAMSLFVGFQWESFGGFTRFGIVIIFTIAWFIASFIIQQTLRLEQVAVVFATIGAILIPFCGVAYQQFVSTSSASLGIVWLFTSIISTIIYISMSLYYHRRYFTYFSNLSILATLLSLVEISSADPAYYVLAANITATILLIARIIIKRTSRTLEEYLAVDIERSSVAIAIFSVIGGALLLSEVAIGVFSIEVFIVLLATLLYMAIYLTLHLNAVSVIITHLLTLLTLGHGLSTFGVDDMLTLYIVLIANVAIQILVHQIIYRRKPEIYSTLSRLSLITATGLYVAVVIITQGGLLAIPAALVLMGHGIYFANETKQDWLWYAIALLWYAITTHILISQASDAEFVLALSVYLAVGAVQLAFLFAPVKHPTAQAFVTVGAIVVAICGFTSLLDYTSNFSAFYEFPAPSPNEAIIIINALIALALLGATLFFDNQRNEPLLLTKPIVWGIGVASGMYYLTSLPAFNDPLSLTFATAILPIVWLVYQRTKDSRLFFVMVAIPYLTITHALILFDASYEFSALIISVYSIALYFYQGLPDDAQIAKHIVPIVAQGVLAFMGFWGGVSTESISIQLMGWFTSYSMIAMLWLARPILGENRGLIAILGLLQYYWHVIFLAQFVNEDLFSNIQWYSAATATVCLLMSVYYTRVLPPEENRHTEPLEILSVLILMFPTYGQILSFGDLLYFALGVVQSLIVVAVGISLKRDRLRNWGGLALIGTVFLQSSDFLLALPRWLVVGVVGFALIGAGLFLSIRRQGNKKPVYDEE